MWGFSPTSRVARERHSRRAYHAKRKLLSPRCDAFYRRLLPPRSLVAYQLRFARYSHSPLSPSVFPCFFFSASIIDPIASSHPATYPSTTQLPSDASVSKSIPAKLPSSASSICGLSRRVLREVVNPIAVLEQLLTELSFKAVTDFLVTHGTPPECPLTFHGGFRSVR